MPDLSPEEYTALETEKQEGAVNKLITGFSRGWSVS
jgi:hypothetical protein